ncbi:MAG: alanine racemase [bacterium]|jgi:alanine racemase
MSHPTKVVIHPPAYQHNLEILRKQLPNTTLLCAVVKADAYGHGIDLLAPVAAESGVHYLGIVDNWEANRIRSLGIATRLIRLRPATLEEMVEARQWGVEEVLGDAATARQIAQVLRGETRTLPVHIKIDTGMGRMGFAFPAQQKDVEELCTLPELSVQGVMTHFPNADEPALETTILQSENFMETVMRLSSCLPPDVIVHSCNSAAALRLQHRQRCMVRLGIASYGLHAWEEQMHSVALEPVMRWLTQVVQVRWVPQGSTIGYGRTCRLEKDSRIATLPVGYAEGYPRQLSNNADVLIHGKRCPVVGRVSMNMVNVDVSHLDDVSAGDEVVMIGRQGEEVILMEELAKRAQMLNYVLPCMIGKCNTVRITTREFMRSGGIGAPSEKGTDHLPKKSHPVKSGHQAWEIAGVEQAYPPFAQSPEPYMHDNHS